MPKPAFKVTRPKKAAARLAHAVTAAKRLSAARKARVAEARKKGFKDSVGMFQVHPPSKLFQDKRGEN